MATARAGSDRISSKDNPRIRAARALHQRRERLARGRFLAEGARLVEDAWQAAIRPFVTYYDPEAVDANPRAALLLELMRNDGVECLACTPQVFATLAETITPQGIVAELPLVELPLPPRITLALVLDGVRDPGNAGTLLRSAEAAGVDCVLFGPHSVDPFNGKVVRAAMGAHMRLPLRDAGAWEQIRSALPPDLRFYVAEMDSALDYDRVDWTQPAALVVGGEAEGASSAARENSHPIRIPMRGRTESLNAAMAGSIILFEAARQRRALAGAGIGGQA